MHTSVYSTSVYNGLVGFASPLVTDRDAECSSPVSAAQSSFAAGTAPRCCSMLFVFSLVSVCVLSSEHVARTHIMFFIQLSDAVA